MDDPIDNLMRRLQTWTPPKDVSLTDFELELRAAHGGRKHYFRSAHDPGRYRIVADRDSRRGK